MSFTKKLFCKEWWVYPIKAYFMMAFSGIYMFTSFLVFSIPYDNIFMKSYQWAGFFGASLLYAYLHGEFMRNV